MTKQSQKGGDSSTNIQAQQMLVQIGIDEKRAREVFQEMNLQLRKEFTQEALQIANTRVSKFEDSLMSKMEKVEGALEAFSDPSFQLLLLDAQKTAASTERPADYDLLSELLIHRFQKGQNRIARAGINFAVEIVDKVSDEALLGLTVAHSVGSFFPVSGDIHQGLDVLDGLYGATIYGELPRGQEWLDHLDILNAVRLNSFGGLKKTQDYYPEMLSGYTDVGIDKGSERHTKAIEILDSNNLPQSLLVDHSLNNEFLRIPVVNKEHINKIVLQQLSPYNRSLVLQTIQLSTNQYNALNSVYDLYSKDNNLKQENIKSFIAEWDKRPSLKILKEWWDSIPILFTITSAGKVLAHSNAQRCDKNLPPLA
jgi:hypothetical protein